MGEGLKLGVTAILFALVWTNINQIETLAVLLVWLPSRRTIVFITVPRKY